MKFYIITTRLKLLLYTVMLSTLPIAFVACNNNSPTGEDDPRGTFSGKVAYWKDTMQGPIVVIADLYDDNGDFGLFNEIEPTQGLAPNLSFDEEWVVYNALDNQFTLSRMRSDGTAPQKYPIDTNLRIESPRFSPDGSLLLFSFLNPFDFHGQHIGVMPVTGGEIRTVYADSGWSSLPDWSPDGRRVYFAWLDLENRYGNNLSPRTGGYIVSTNVDGSDWQVVTDTTIIGSDLYPAVSPDGTQIAFTSQRNHLENVFPEVFIMNIDGGNVRQITECVGCVRHDDHFDNYTLDANPVWTKDGNYILFPRDVYIYDHGKGDYDNKQDIYIVKSDGAGLQQLTKQGSSLLGKFGDPGN